MMLAPLLSYLSLFGCTLLLSLFFIQTRPMDLDSVYEEQKVTTGTVLFTYDVIWRPSNIHWASRWDIYLSMDNAVPDKVNACARSSSDCCECG